MAIYWIEEINLLPAMLIFLFLFLLELANLLIYNKENKIGLISYFSYLYDNNLWQEREKLLKNFTGLFKSHNKLFAGFMVLMALALIVIIGLILELTLLWIIGTLYLIFVFYFAPKLEIIVKDHLTVGFILVLLDFILVFIFYFSHGVEFQLSFLALLFILILLKFNIFLYKHNYGTYLLEELSIINNFTEIKFYNGIYFIMILLIYVLYGFHFSLVSSILWIVPFIGLPVAIYKTVINNRKIYQSLEDKKELLNFHYWNIIFYQANLLLIVLITLIEKFFAL